MVTLKLPYYYIHYCFFIAYVINASLLINVLIKRGNKKSSFWTIVHYGTVTKNHRVLFTELSHWFIQADVIDLEKRSNASVDSEALDLLWLYLHASSGNRPYRRQIYTLQCILPPIPASILNGYVFTWECRSSSKACYDNLSGLSLMVATDCDASSYQCAPIVLKISSARDAWEEERLCNWGPLSWVNTQYPHTVSSWLPFVCG